MANRAAQFRQQNNGLPVVSRERHSLTLDLGDGRKRLITTVEPLHYGDGQEIDDSWAQTTGAWQWRMVNNRFSLFARSVLNAGDILQWLDPSGESVTVQPLALNWVNNETDSRQQITQPQSVTAQVEDNTLYWANGYGQGRHFRYISHPRRLIKHLIIDSADKLPSPASWLNTSNPYLEIEFIVKRSAGTVFWIDGAPWDNSTKTATANRVEVRHSVTGEILWYFDAPTATDAEGDVCPGVFQLRSQGNQRYCTVRIPKSWLDTAVWPVVIDPTFTDGYGGDVDTASDTRFSSGSPTSNYGSDASLRVSGVTRSGVMVFTLSSLSDVTVTSATLYMTKTGGSGTLTLNRILAANAGWTEMGATWNTKDGTNGWAGISTYGGCLVPDVDYDSDALGALNLAIADKARASASLDLDEFAAMVASNHGIAFRAGSSDDVAPASSDHDTSGYRPALVVEYEEGGEPTELVVQDATHAHTASAPNLIEHKTLVVQGTSHGQSVTSPVLAQAHTLVVDSTSHAQAVDAPTLLQDHTLNIADASHGQSTDALTLSQAHVLDVDSATHGHTADNVALSTCTSLVVNDTTHGHTASTPTLTQAHLLTVADGIHAQTADNIDLSGSAILTVQDAVHGHTTETPTITQAHTLAVADAGHAQSVDNLDLTQAHILAVQDAMHAQVSDEPTLVVATILLIVQDAVHGQSASTVMLIQAHTLVVASTIHAHMADNVAFRAAPGEPRLTLRVPGRPTSFDAPARTFDISAPSRPTTIKAGE